MKMANGSPSAGVGGWVEVQTHCNHLDSLSSSDLTHIPSPHSPCNRCHHPDENWLCLGCKVVLCSRYVNKHMLEHYQQTNHCLCLGYRDLSVWCYICHAFLDAQVIVPLRPIYETAYALKFGRALTPQTAEYLHQGATVDCNESEFDTEDSADDVGNADVAPTKNPPSNGSVAALWEGHSVNESYVDLFSLIKKAHPETFEHCSFKTPSLHTSALNTLGEFYTLFASSRVDEMTVNDIGHFRDMFSDLELLRFNVGWLRERLDRIEELRVNGGLLREYEELLDHVKVKERELAEVKILCAAKEMVLRAMYGFLGEKDSTRCAADGLLPGLSQRK